MGIVSASLAVPTPAQTKSPAVVPSAPKPSSEEVLVRIDSFRDLIWRPADNYFLSPGPVRIQLRSVARGETMVLTADDAEGRPDGDIAVKGKLTLVREGSTVTGRHLTLNPVTETGSILEAEALVGRIRVRGDRLAMSPRRGLVAGGASFTTCEGAPPHYRITARELRLSENGTVTARGVTLWIGNKPILAVPWLQKSFRNKVESPFPLPGYSKETGPIFKLRNDIQSSPASALTYEVVASLRKAPYGNLTFERDMARVDPEAAPPATRKVAWREPIASALEMHRTFSAPDRDPWDDDHRVVAYAAAGVLDYVGHRTRTDLRLSRLPEIGIAGHRSGQANGRGGEHAQMNSQGNGTRTNAGFGYHWDLSAGRYFEKPTDVEATRTALRAGVATPSLEVLPGLSLRAGIAASGQAYDAGQTYTTLAPELEAYWSAQERIGFGVAFKHQLDGGKTPFAFDRVDVRNEMRLACRGDSGGWAYSLAVCYDTDRMRAYDTSFAVRRKLDCMEFGLTYRSRSQGLGVIFNLLPGEATSNRQRED